MRISRRHFLAKLKSAGAAGLAAPFLWPASSPAFQPARPLADLHVHLFGKGDSRSGCRLAPAITESLNFQILAGVLRLHERANTVDESYVLALAEHLQQSGLQKGLVLAHDAVYDQHGEPDWAKTPFYYGGVAR